MLGLVLLQTLQPRHGAHQPDAHEEEEEEGNEADHLQIESNELRDIMSGPLRTFLNIRQHMFKDTSGKTRCVCSQHNAICVFRYLWILLIVTATAAIETCITGNALYIFVGLMVHVIIKRFREDPTCCAKSNTCQQHYDDSSWSTIRLLNNLHPQTLTNIQTEPHSMLFAACIRTEKSKT